MVEAAEGADFVLLPECANLMEQRRDLKAGKLASEDDDIFVQGVRQLARDLKTPILVGSVIIKAENSDKSAEEIVSAVNDQVEDFVGRTPFHDDRTLIVVKMV